MIRTLIFILVGCFLCGAAEEKIGNILNLLPPLPNFNLTSSNDKNAVPCMCGVFLSGQFEKGSVPKESPIFMHEHDEHFMCNAGGNKQCINKCLDVLVKYLANSPSLICGAIDRDCYKERAYLFIKNCGKEWINSNLSAGREFCCKNGEPYKCPLL
ncbi:follicle cell protein 3C [Rhodnius prolixus]|uniref:follicle cell protein 3C n=1 Tax=Rhodnius prolixus TaxID=13249 RepID=UPI003D18D381